MKYSYPLQIFSLSALLATGCAHSYHYRPEIEGDGATFGGNGVVYPVPVEQPQIQMKLFSTGVGKAPRNSKLPPGTQPSNFFTHFPATLMRVTFNFSQFIGKSFTERENPSSKSRALTGAIRFHRPQRPFPTTLPIWG